MEPSSDPFMGTIKGTTKGTLRTLKGTFDGTLVEAAGCIFLAQNFCGEKYLAGDFWPVGNQLPSLVASCPERPSGPENVALLVRFLMFELAPPLSSRVRALFGE